MAGKTHPACRDPTACEAKYSFALKTFAQGMTQKKTGNYSQAVVAFQCALTLLRGCCHANASVLTLSVAFRLAETRMRAHQFEAAVDGATWCIQAAQRLGVSDCMHHQILLVRGLALLSLGHRDAALRDIKDGCASLPLHRREQGAQCLRHIQQALAHEDSCCSQESTMTDDDEVTSTYCQYVDVENNKRLRL